MRPQVTSHLFARFSHRVLFVLGMWLLGQGLYAPSASAGRGSAAQADDAVTARAKVHLEAGVAYFNESQYADAEREMLRAYELRPVPELKYNLAQCQERLGALDRAVDSYRAYLHGRPDAVDIRDVEARIAGLEDRLKAAQKEPSQTPTPNPDPPPAAPVQNVAPPQAEKVIFKEIIVYKEAPPKPGRAFRFAGLGLIGVAAAGLATGIAFSVATSQLDTSIDQQSAVFQAQFNIPTSSCPNMNSVEAAVLARANKDAAAIAGTNMALQQQLSGELANSYRPLAKNVCEFFAITGDNRRLNNTGIGVGFTIAALSLVGAIGLFIYASHLDKKQDRELKQKTRATNLSLLVRPEAGPTGGGLVISGRF